MAGGDGGSGSGPSGGGGSGGGSNGDGMNDAGGDNGGKHMMQPWTYAFAAFLAAGGIFAFVKAGSTKSLTSSCSAAVILALCARSMAGPAALNSARVAFGE